MPQLSLYLDDQTMNALRDMADIGGTSLSKCAAELIRNAAVNEWPPSVERLIGSIDDVSFKQPVRIMSKRDVKEMRMREEAVQ